MEQSLFFGNAAWIEKKERTPKTFTVIRGHFDVNKAEKMLNILELGFFKCYINGKCIIPILFCSFHQILKLPAIPVMR